MEISVRQSSIKPKHIKKLLQSGILLVSHLNTFDKTRLALKTHLSQDECEQILAVVKPKRPHYIVQLSELMIKPFDRISTTIKGLDIILGGGIRCGHITEISGEAGAGKSNLCTQISIDSIVAERENSKNSEVLLIFTEGRGKLQLTMKRLKDLASSIEKEDLVKSRMHVKACRNEFELEEIVNRLPELIEAKPSIKLVIIDSITCAFIVADEKPGLDFYLRRSLRLTRVAKCLARVAWDRRLAVIATNHVSYNFKEGQNRPALGKVWSHLCQSKIYLERNNSARLAHVTKGALNAPEPVRFVVTNKQPSTLD